MPTKISTALRQRAASIKLFLCDVDGVLGTREKNGVCGRLRLHERQRRSILQPWVGAQRLPWASNDKSINPEGVESCPHTIRLKPFQGCDIVGPHTQGSLRCRQPWADGLNAVGVPQATTDCLSVSRRRSAFAVRCSMFSVSHL